jgi:hypothetical protein
MNRIFLVFPSISPLPRNNKYANENSWLQFIIEDDELKPGGIKK